MFMKIVEEGPDRLVFKQGRNLWGYIIGTIFLLVSVGMIYAFWFHPTQETGSQYYILTGIAIVVCIVFGLLGVYFSGKTMTVVFDKKNRIIQSTNSSTPSLKDASAILRQDGPGIIRFDEIEKISWFTGTLGVVLKNGERVQFGTGGVNVYSKAIFARKLSDFLNVPIEEAYAQNVIDRLQHPLHG